MCREVLEHRRSMNVPEAWFAGANAVLEASPGLPYGGTTIHARQAAHRPRDVGAKEVRGWRIAIATIGQLFEHANARRHAQQTMQRVRVGADFARERLAILRPVCQ